MTNYYVKQLSHDKGVMLICGAFILLHKSINDFFFFSILSNFAFSILFFASNSGSSFSKLNFFAFSLSLKSLHLSAFPNVTLFFFVSLLDSVCNSL